MDEHFQITPGPHPEFTMYLDARLAIALGVKLADVMEESWLEWLPMDSSSAEPPVSDEFWRRPYRPLKST
ncbi:MAG TPA: hypothetical protein VNV42_17160 [Solirubrobacteraceae bacterium]|nr:hypothetical protein [Solirubrobacteraceae bacterium]